MDISSIIKCWQFLHCCRWTRLEAIAMQFSKVFVPLPMPKHRPRTLLIDSTESVSILFWVNSIVFCRTGVPPVQNYWWSRYSNGRKCCCCKVQRRRNVKKSTEPIKIVTKSNWIRACIYDLEYTDNLPLELGNLFTKEGDPRSWAMFCPCKQFASSSKDNNLAVRIECVFSRFLYMRIFKISQLRKMSN